jgi:chloride channel protein, CIC family
LEFPQWYSLEALAPLCVHDTQEEKANDTDLIIIGMSACLGAVVRAPFTSILIVFEMTQEFSLIPALLVAGILSQALCRRLESIGFYERVLKDDGHSLDTVMPPRDFREWASYPVSAICNYQPARLPDLEKTTLETAMAQFPYASFVFQVEEQPPGIILRDDIVSALKRITSSRSRGNPGEGSLGATSRSHGLRDHRSGTRHHNEMASCDADQSWS